MLVETLQLTDFRNYARLDLELGSGLTVVTGDNGHGKTNLLEAIGYVAGMGSFRGAPTEALVRTGSESGFVRTRIESDGGRPILIDCEIARSGRHQVKVNHQRLRRARDLVGELVVTIFSPTDLELVKGSPALRRDWLDDALVASDRRLDGLRSDVDRILKQRNALLKQAHGRQFDEVVTTLDVWDSKLAVAGDELRARRITLLERLGPHLSGAYRTIADHPATIVASYSSSWPDGSLADALASVRTEDLRRGVTTIGPHRDEIVLAVDDTPARTHASQGEQRSLALALRLATDAVVRESGAGRPVLLLDDVFSELDSNRATALLDALPDAQRILTTASGVPAGAEPDRVLRVVDGAIRDGP